MSSKTIIVVETGAPSHVARLIQSAPASKAAIIAHRKTVGSATDSGVEFAPLLGRLVSSLVMFVVIIMAISQLKIDTEIVRSSRRHHGENPNSGDGGFMDQLEGHLQQGMDPAEVGDLVLDAVRNERFWILTHPEMELAAVERRLAKMQADHTHRL